MNSTACTTESQQILNVAAYKFVTLSDLPALREELKQACVARELRGTILLSPEGINLFLAGNPAKLSEFLDTLRTRPEFADLTTKDSYSAEQPFRRMLVRLKTEIIAFGVDGIEPGEKTSPKLPAMELKRWLDEGRKVRLLDVRNDYEFDLGSFHGAEKLGIDHFRDFPEMIGKLPDEAKREPVVMFCTGGIRCEKAGPLMEKAGFESVYQLDGGILKYFEECGDAHYEGSCFVFDSRVALNARLEPTGDQLCFACQAVLTPQDVSSDQYLLGKYCPHCYSDPTEVYQSTLQQRQADIWEVASSQPGCSPYTNVRNIFVPRRYASMSLIDFLTARHPGVAREAWLAWLEAGQILRRSSDRQQLEAVDSSTRVRDGDHFEQQLPDTLEPEINPNIQLLHEDDDLIVVNKPAPLPSHPSGRFNRNSLSWILGKAYRNDKLRIAHRLDANTSGVAIVCRKQRAAKLLQQQFASHSVKKLYLARVHGHPGWDAQRCEASISPEAGPGGARSIVESGLQAVTEFVVRQRFDDGTSLVEARPITGRTNQIRIHLWHLGHSIVGDPLYQAHGKLGETHTLLPTEAPMCLHAAQIELRHPANNQPVCYACELPAWTQG